MTTSIPTDSSFSLAPRRRTSLLSRSRPVTAYGLPCDIESRYHDKYSRRNSMVPSESGDMFQNLERGYLSQGKHQLARPETSRSIRSRGPSSYRPPPALSNTISEPEYGLPTPQERSSISSSIRNGFKSLGRRLSTSRHKSTKSQQEPVYMQTQAHGGSAIANEQVRDEDPDATPKAKKSWFRSPSVRRRPSLPVLRGTALSRNPTEFENHEFILPASRRGPPVFADFTQAGAGARAAAAAQNEAFHTAQSSFDSTWSISSRLSRIKITRDSESGIGIEAPNRHPSTASVATLIRKDPASTLPAEIMEQILQTLDAESVLSSQLVSSSWHELATSAVVWRTIFSREYVSLVPSNISSTTHSNTALGLGRYLNGQLVPQQEWKHLFKTRRAIDDRWATGEAAAIYLTGHRDSVYCVQFDEDKIITGSRDCTMRVWNAKTYRCIKVIGVPSTRAPLPLERTNPQNPPTPLVSLTASSPDSLTLSSQANQMHHTASILCLQYDHEILVSGSSDHTAIVWSVQQNYTPRLRLTGHTAGVLDVCISATTIITCSKDTSIMVWDRTTGDPIRTLHGHRGPVNAVQFRPDSGLLASASGDGMCKLWRLAEGLCIKEFSSKDRGLACVEFSRDGSTIFAGGNDRVIYEYDTRSGKCVRQLKGHRDLVRSLHFDPVNDRIVSGSYDRSIKVWGGTSPGTSPGTKAYSGRSETQTKTFPGGLELSLEDWTTSWMLAAKSDYRKIVGTSQDGRVIVVDFGYGIDGVEALQAS